MNIIKKRSGKGYMEYFVETECSFCNKLILVNKSNIRLNKINVCNHDCKRLYHQRLKDPKSIEILNNKNNNFYYLIGMICADGYISYPGYSKASNGYFVGIELHQHDIDILTNIHNIFGGKLIKLKKGNCYKWSMSNKEFVIYLQNIGLTHKKSHTIDIADWFKLLTIDQKWNFIRGVFDGDGCISGNKKHWVSFICGCSEKFIDMIHTFCVSQNIKCYKHQKTTKNGTIYSSIINGKYIEYFMKCIYNNAVLCMIRKKEKYLEYKEIYDDN
jgi:hypothetical protein